MKLDSAYLSKFKIAGRKTSSKLEMADIIYQNFRKQIKFARLMRIIGDIGERAAYMNFKECGKADNPPALFLYLCGEDRKNIHYFE